MRKVICFAPHPDDETLGCGGTLLKHLALGDDVIWVIMTKMSEEAGFQKSEIERREREIKGVAKEFSFKKYIELGYVATQLDEVPFREVARKVKDILDSIKPEVAYIPFGNDIHSDHKITFNAVISAAKSFRTPYLKTIKCYEVVSETEFAPSFQNASFVPNSFSDVSGFIEKKISIMKNYKGELSPPPFPRSIENIKSLARFRGATAGVEYAEAYMILKEIW